MLQRGADSGVRKRTLLVHDHRVWIIKVSVIAGVDPDAAASGEVPQHTRRREDTYKVSLIVSG